MKEKEVIKKGERDPFFVFCSQQKDNMGEAFGTFDADNNFFINFNCNLNMNRMISSYKAYLKRN